MGEADIVYDIKSGIFQFYCTNCKTLQECSVKENDSGKIRCRGCRCEIFFSLKRRYTEFKVYLHQINPNQNL